MKGTTGTASAERRPGCQGVQALLHQERADVIGPRRPTARDVLLLVNAKRKGIHA